MMNNMIATMRTIMNGPSNETGADAGAGNGVPTGASRAYIAYYLRSGLY